jgi:hypothetical protein
METESLGGVSRISEAQRGALLPPPCRLLSDVAKDGRAAIEWAYKDLSLRENFAIQGALAWAFYRDGQAGEAVIGSIAPWRPAPSMRGYFTEPAGFTARRAIKPRAANTSSEQCS